MSIALRQTVADTRAFCTWAAGAPPGAVVMYHIGNIGADRIANAILHDLAETVRLLAMSGWVATHQHRISLAAIQGFSYVATRTGIGWAPQSLLHSRIRAAHYIALRAVQSRDPHMSARRAIRDAMSCPDSAAGAMLDVLKAAGWVEEAEIKGWAVSDAGHQMLL